MALVAVVSETAEACRPGARPRDGEAHAPFAMRKRAAPRRGSCTTQETPRRGARRTASLDPDGSHRGRDDQESKRGTEPNGTTRHDTTRPNRSPRSSAPPSRRCIARGFQDPSHTGADHAHRYHRVAGPQGRHDYGLDPPGGPTGPHDSRPAGRGDPHPPPGLREARPSRDAGPLTSSSTTLSRSRPASSRPSRRSPRNALAKGLPPAASERAERPTTRYATVGGQFRSRNAEWFGRRRIRLGER
jgi:hypothetical protein